MRQLTAFAAFSVFAISSGAFARGSKNVNMVNQSGSNWYQNVKANYTSEFKGAASAAGGSEFTMAQRELEAVNLEISNLQSKVEADNKLLNQPDTREGLEVLGGKTQLSGGRSEQYLKNKGKLEQLEIRARKLEAVADKNVAELSNSIKTRDAKLIASLKDMPLDNKNGVVTGEDMADFAANTLARLELSDLKMDWQVFVGKAGNASAQLKIVKAKLDNSIVGTYINQGVLQSSNFCAAVKKASDAKSCDGYGIDGASAAKPIPVVPEKKTEADPNGKDHK